MLVNQFKHTGFVNEDRQRGLSLIELMLAMLISLLVLQQLTQLISRTLENYRGLTQSIHFYESAEMAFSVLQSAVDLSGYQAIQTNTINTFAQQLRVLSLSTTVSNIYHQRSYASITTAGSVFINSPPFVTASVVYGIDNAQRIAGLKNGTDLLMLRFQTPPQGIMRDCKNTILQARQLYQLDFFIDANNDFRCRGAPSVNGARYSAVLAVGISDFQLEYAYRDFASNKIKFCSAKCITDDNKWADIIAIKVELIPAFKGLAEDKSRALQQTFFIENKIN